MRILILISILIVCITAQAPKWALEMLDYVNEARKAAGVDPVCLGSKLTKAASTFSKTLEKEKRFDHIGSDGSTPSKRAKKEGCNFKALTENLASPDTPKKAFERFMISPVHRDNILAKAATLMGVGGTSEGDVHEGNWVQMFAASTDECDLSPDTGRNNAKQAPGGGNNSTNTNNGGGNGGNSTNFGAGQQNFNETQIQIALPPPSVGDAEKFSDEVRAAKFKEVMEQLMNKGSGKLIVIPFELKNSIIDGGSFVVSGGKLGCLPCNVKPATNSTFSNVRDKCKCIEQR